MDIGLVAHDAMKKELLEWVKYNAKVLFNGNTLYCTGTTGKLIREVYVQYRLEESIKSFNSINVTKEVEDIVYCLHSGPLGGDQEMGSMIANGHIDVVIFFADHLSMQAHDSDIKALSRLAGLYNIPMACNRATADYLISSTLWDSDYKPAKPDFTSYTKREIKL